jgi:hypothetical protein
MCPNENRVQEKPNEGFSVGSPNVCKQLLLAFR